MARQQSTSSIREHGCPALANRKPGDWASALVRHRERWVRRHRRWPFAPLWQKSCWRDSLEITGKSGRLNLQKSNLRFEDDHLVLEATVQGQKLLATLDTGAVNTDLFEGFAKQFVAMINGSAKKESMELKGIGGTETLDAINLPELKFKI